MNHLAEGDVVSIAVKITDKIGKEIDNTGTVVMISDNRVMVLLPSGDLWIGSVGCVYPAQQDVA